MKTCKTCNKPAEIDKAIKFFEEEEVFYIEDDCDEERATYCGLAVMVLQERRERLRQRETPLTYRELQQMDGKPVFLQYGTGMQCWAIVCTDGRTDVDAYVYFYGSEVESEDNEPDCDFYNMEYNDPSGSYGLHRLGWRAYREKPRQKGGAE